MEITCLQMDVLISFYIDGDLSQGLKEKVEQHLKVCPTCRAKYNILSSLFSEMQTKCTKNTEEICSAKSYPTKDYRNFRTNLSAYIDNELPPEESIKMKKFTINNKNARKELEDTYNIRKLLSNSFRKTKTESKSDFSKKILKQLDIEDRNQLNFNPLIMVSAAFVFTVLVISIIVMYILSM